MSKNIKETLGENAEYRVASVINELQADKNYKFDLPFFFALLQLAQMKNSHQADIQSGVISIDDTEPPQSNFSFEDYEKMNRFLDLITVELMVDPITFSSFRGLHNAENVSLFLEAVKIVSTQSHEESAQAFSG